jgi:hypothetical protein
MRRLIHHFFLVLLLTSLCVPALHAQIERSELRIQIEDSTGAPLAVTGALTGNAKQIAFTTTDDGRSTLGNLGFGDYTLEAHAPGFATATRHLALYSTLPRRITLRLVPGTVQQSVTVSVQEIPLLDMQQPGATTTLTRLDEKSSAQPGRSLLEALVDQPGWIFEANGVVHPRGSEYQTQFVINGIPRTENISPAFAMPLSANDVESAQVRTAGYPAEYGRSLGGIVDITTTSSTARGLHGTLAASGGSFNTRQADAALSYGTESHQTALFADAYGTDRFFDPPTLDNFTNNATAQNTRIDHQWQLTDRDHLQLDVAQSRLHSTVPNEALQQQAGQRQDRTSTQISGSATLQHIFSPDLLLSATASGLDSSATLASNALSTPIAVSQDRGFRQAYARIDLAGHHGIHDWKIGVDALLRHARERLHYDITDDDFFDDDTPSTFSFAGTHWDSEPAAYVQDNIHKANWNLALGLRYDNYSFILHRNAFSPRVAVSRYVPAISTVFHVSYDRVFQAPPIENLLLASSPTVASLSDFVDRLPVEPGTANFYEAGFTTAIAHTLRISGNIFLRKWRNYADDDTLLNTGVSFPFADRRANIHGEELAIALPNWHRITAQLSYSNQTGAARGPITGGLLLGDEGADALTDTGRFAISQDQRNTLRSSFRYAPTSRFWLGAAAQYNSGLPVELDDNVDIDNLRQQYGDRIVSQVNFNRGRVRPWSSMDVSGGVTLFRTERTHADLDIHTANLADRVNVINFASLFSGTAVAAPRSFNARLRFAF